MNIAGQIQDFLETELLNYVEADQYGAIPSNLHSQSQALEQTHLPLVSSEARVYLRRLYISLNSVINAGNDLSAFSILEGRTKNELVGIQLEISMGNNVPSMINEFNLLTQELNTNSVNLAILENTFYIRLEDYYDKQRDFIEYVEEESIIVMAPAA
jgi:hypothetical protein